MKQVFSNQWKASVQPRKQRKYAANAPKHIKSGLLGAHLSSELKAKYKTRSVRVRVGDRVKVLRGQFKGTIGKVERVDVENQRVYVEKVELNKKDGSKSQYPLASSNLIVIELNLKDQKRKEKLSGA